ncbi:MAG: hypothetical protein R3C60_04140 [Parvularculaceae bacterium]
MRFINKAIQNIKTISAEKYLEYVTDLILDLALIVLDFISSPILVPIRIAKAVVLKLSKGFLLRGIRHNAHRITKNIRPKPKDLLSTTDAAISNTEKTGA